MLKIGKLLENELTAKRQKVQHQAALRKKESESIRKLTGKHIEVYGVFPQCLLRFSVVKWIYRSRKLIIAPNSNIFVELSK